MPFLDWSEKKTVHTFAAPSGKTQLTLQLDTRSNEELVSKLETIFLHGSKELRLVLDQHWTLFWKMKEGESRALIAHPEKDVWVGTVALASSDGLALIAQIKNLSHQPSPSIVLSKLIALGSFSNFELVVVGQQAPQSL